MKTNIQKNAVVIALSFLTILAFTLTSCQKEQQTQPAKTSTDLSEEKVAEINYQYLLGADFLIGPDKAVAPNGDTIAITGSGTFSIHSKSVTGNGTFQHINAAGTLLASGTWNALELLSFKSFGSAASTFPPGYEGGKAFIRIHLTPDTGGSGFDAILQIYCVIPGSNPPAAFDEGIRLVVQDLINFNKSAGGQTLFIRQ